VIGTNSQEKGLLHLLSYSKCVDKEIKEREGEGERERERERAIFYIFPYT